MTVPAGVTLWYNGNPYYEGQTVPKEAESLVPSALPQSPTAPAPPKSQTAPSSGS